VSTAQYTTSPKWREDHTAVLQKANKESKLSASAEVFQKQLEQYQEEELVRLFASMKKIGGKPAVNFLINFSLKPAVPEKQRVAALAALENNLDKNDTRHADAMFALAAGSDTPDSVRDLALRRIGEMPRKNVVERLYGLFENQNWKVRWVAAELVLKMSNTAQLPEFADHLGHVSTMALSEPLRYGELVGAMKGAPKPEVFVSGWLEPGQPVPVRLTALSWYFHNGTAPDVDKLKRWSGEKTRTPKCAPDAKECEWKCEYRAADGKSVVRDITTVGDFVLYCVVPEIERRIQPNKK
jgi:hypothetical protein